MHHPATPSERGARRAILPGFLAHRLTGGAAAHSDAAHSAAARRAIA